MGDLTGDAIKIIGKGNKERKVFLPEEYYQVLLKYIEWRNNKYGTEIPYLFVSKMRCKYAGGSIRSKLKSIMARANFSPERIAELHTHSTRHTAAANFEENGIDIKVAQVILGHANLSTTANLYAHVRDSRIESAMRNQKTYL
jgi:site-specific recombinase XerD